jgi:hypothetical protein
VSAACVPPSLPGNAGETTLTTRSTPTPIEARIAAQNWAALASHLDQRGFAVTSAILTSAECDGLRASYSEQATFRSHVVMQRHGYGQGEYKYFAYPLPPLITGLRTALYENLAPIANRWEQSLGRMAPYPTSHADFLAACHAQGQTRPTPLLLQYRQDDFNCLHQDLYGDLAFSLQVAFLLSDPGSDFEGGEFVLTEQRPRMQSRVEVVPLQQGQGVIFAVNHRPVKGTRGMYRTAMRHGVSRLRAGHRHTLGIIFHDAR